MLDMTTKTIEESAEPQPGTVAVPEQDGLARPISFEAKNGAGRKRALVLGGGGIFFVAWQVAYLNGLINRGVHLGDADIVVGTSAGSVVASILTSGGIRRFGVQVDLLSKIPALVGILAPASNFHPSQMRALELFQRAEDAEPNTVRPIGFAALAARTPSAAETRRSVGFALAARRWPSKSLYITATDAYSGERLVLDHHTDISVVRAAAASSAVPGIFSPQPIHDRYCMDGGVSGSGTHCDLVAGAEKALVISLGASIKQVSSMMTIKPDTLARELAGLTTSGTTAYSRGPDKFDITQMMSPAAVPDALALGDELAGQDAAEIAAFWNLPH